MPELSRNTKPAVKMSTALNSATDSVPPGAPRSRQRGPHRGINPGAEMQRGRREQMPFSAGRAETSSSKKTDERSLLKKHKEKQQVPVFTRNEVFEIEIPFLGTKFEAANGLILLITNTGLNLYPEVPRQMNFGPRGWIAPGLVAIQSQGTYRQTRLNTHIHTYGQFSLQRTLDACFGKWEEAVIRNQDLSSVRQT